MSEAKDLFKLNPVKFFPGYIAELEQQNKELIEFAKIAHRVSGLADKEDYGITLLYKKSIELLSKYK
jgi:hypothetical protein